MARQVLQTTGHLEDAGARLQRKYEWARLESLRDPLTGLGNHRAFQEELALGAAFKPETVDEFKTAGWATVLGLALGAGSAALGGLLATREEISRVW
jgi:hypothetical protein